MTPIVWNFVVLNVIFVIFSLVGNSVVSFFYARKPLRNPSNLYVVNLAICDLVTSISNPVIIASAILDRQFFNDALCGFFGATISLGCIGSMFNMGIIAFTRYIVIVKVNWKSKLTYRNAAIGIVVQWVVTFLLIVPGYTKWGRIVYYDNSYLCVFDWAYNVYYTAVIFVASFLLPTIIIGYSYLKIFLKFRESKKSLESHSSNKGGKKPKHNSQEFRLALQLLVIFLVYLVCWIPYFLLALFIDPHGQLSDAVYSPTQLLIFFNSALNPFIYVVFNKKFREILLCGGCHSKVTADGTQVETITE